MKDHDGQPRDGGPELHEYDLERRVAELEERGQLVRRILEKGRLVEGYRATRRTG